VLKTKKTSKETTGAVVAEPAKSFTFGPFQLDVGQHVLLREGKPVPLPPKAVTILSVLVEKHGPLVEREELMRRAWPDVFVEDGNLSVAVSMLRKTLAGGFEGFDGVSLIETIPKHGYRFTATVETKETPNGIVAPVEHTPRDAGVPEIPGILSPVSAGPGRWRSPALAGVTALALLGVLGAGIFLHFSKSSAPHRTARISLAVLPFKNLTGSLRMTIFRIP